MKPIEINSKPNYLTQKNITFYFLFSLIYVILFFTVSESVLAQSEVYLSIKTGSKSLLGVGVGEFRAYADTSGIYSEYAELPDMVRNTLVSDLEKSGLFEVKTLTDSIGASTSDLLAQWSKTGAAIFLFGEQHSAEQKVVINVIDLKTTATILSETYLIEKDRPWYTAHVIVDDMIELFTGLRGSMASQIAFVNLVKEETNEIHLIQADGRGKRQLTYSNALSLSPSWSSDGTSLAFSSLFGDNWSLMNINVNTGQTQLVSNWSGLNTAPSWSSANPDIIAFSSTRDGNNEVYTCRSDGKNIRRLTNHYSIDSSPTWSPDGEKIAFTSDRTGQPAIYVMNRDGRNVHRLTSVINAYEDSPCWSPRGDRIVFVVLFDRSFDIATVSPSGGDLVMLTFGEGSNENPRWSPDGLRIIFSSTRFGGKNLFIMNWDGTNVRPLTTDNQSYSPAWAPASSGNDIRVSSRR